ncbi:MAG: C1 family peptidase [Pseudomonadota bacterium]
MKTVFVLAIAATSVVFSIGCRPAIQSDSQPQTFETPNTEIKNQGRIGFCWAYAAIAMIESDYKRRTGKDIDLSEESLGFFLLAEYIKQGGDQFLRTALSLPTTQPKIEEGSSIPEAFSLIARWGLIPESQWSVKFDTDSEVNQAKDSIAGEWRQKVEALRINGSNAVPFDDVVSILTKKAFRTPPPFQSFDNGSGAMSAIRYAREVIGFNPNNYEFVTIDGAAGSSAFSSNIQRIKEVLSRGGVVGIELSMPASDPSSASRIQGKRFIGMGMPFKIDGAHAMVITDFKNSNGNFGKSLNPMEEVAKPLEPGMQFQLKNSWGSQSGFNEFGAQVQTGYYEMDVMYLLDILQSGGIFRLTFPRI